MATVLILFAHPLLEKSRAHLQLIAAARNLPGVTIHDLYERYPDFDIDVRREQQLLSEHDYIVLQFPFYWYSTPPLLKQWQDLVLEHGWAYGRKGTALEGKRIFAAISSGGSQEAYQEQGFNRYPLADYLRPLERTAGLCRMQWWPPFWVPGVHRIDDHDLRRYGQQYRQLLTALTGDLLRDDEALNAAYLNELLPSSTNTI